MNLYHGLISVLVFIYITLLVVDGSDSRADSIFGLVDFELGKSQGFSRNSEISDETLQKILVGVRNQNKNSIYFYGLIKLYGIAVTKDSITAASSFKIAGELGHVEALTAYGVCLMTGNGATQNNYEAITWLRKGVDAGDTNAHWLLGKLLLENKGMSASISIDKQHEEAVKLIRYAADKHIPQAEHYLALVYEYGISPVQQDFRLAGQYYQQAADQRYLESMYNLALMYAYGRGFPQDFLRAKSLFEAAARSNHAPSVYYMGIFKYHGYGENYDVYEEEAKYGIEADHSRRHDDNGHVYQKRDYEMALNWFEKAAVLDDSRVSEKAGVVAAEIRELLSQARHINDETIKQFLVAVVENV